MNVPVSNEEARALAEQVFSQPVPPHVTEVAEALLDVLSRLETLQTQHNQLLDSSVESIADAYDKGRRYDEDEDDRTSENG